VRVWQIPAFESGDIDITTPDFTPKQESPF
jgi:hypothetical protein